MKKITALQGKKLIEAWDGKESSNIPKEKFYWKGEEKWIGLDNITGDCWVEDFSSESLVKAWLMGEFEASEEERYLDEKIGREVNRTEQIENAWKEFIEEYPKMDTHKNKKYFELLFDVAPRLSEHPIAVKTYLNSSAELTPGSDNVRFDTLKDLVEIDIQILFNRDGGRINE